MTMRCVCAVFDSASQLFGTPIFMPATGSAIRSFTDEVNRAAADNALHQHPGDFELRLLAYFDDESGVFMEPPDGPRVLIRGKDCARQSEA